MIVYPKGMGDAGDAGLSIAIGDGVQRALIISACVLVTAGLFLAQYLQHAAPRRRGRA